MLHERESLCRKAVRKPVIHANRKRNDTLKDQIADLGFVRPSNGSISGKLKASNRQLLWILPDEWGANRLIG